MEEVLSIIIPFYYGGKYIQKTIQSIFCSSYHNLEIIIVNNGSTDRERLCLEAIKKGDKRIKIIETGKIGLCKARNLGASHASGKFICFCDQDDIVCQDMYRRMIEVLEETETDMCICSCGLYINGQAIQYDMYEDKVYSGREIVNNLILPTLITGFCLPSIKGTHYPTIWNCIFRRSFWKSIKCKFRAYVNYEDDFLVKIETLSMAHEVSTVSYMGYLWRVHMDSDTYVHDFVDNIGSKQDHVIEDLSKSISNLELTAQEKILVIQIIRCRQYMDAVNNIAIKSQRIGIKQIEKYFFDNIYCRDFDKSIKAIKYRKKGYIKLNILLPLLMKRKSKTVYFLCILLEKLRRTSLSLNILTRLERLTKKL